MNRDKKQEDDKEIKDSENMITICRLIYVPTEMPPMMRDLYPEDTKMSTLIVDTKYSEI